MIFALCLQKWEQINLDDQEVVKYETQFEKWTQVQHILLNKHASSVQSKAHINYLTKKVKRNIGSISKIRYFVDLGTLIILYYSLTCIYYPFLTYSIITWGHTYCTCMNPSLNLFFYFRNKPCTLLLFFLALNTPIHCSNFWI